MEESQETLRRWSFQCDKYLLKQKRSLGQSLQFISASLGISIDSCKRRFLLLNKEYSKFM